MKKLFTAVLMLILCFGVGCAEYDWLRQWDDLSIFDSGSNAYSVCRDGLWGTVDENGNVLVEPRFDEPFYYEEDFFPVCISGRYGFADGSGKLIVPAEYEEACVKFDSRLGWARKDGMYALVGEKGLISDFVYEDAQSLWGALILKKDGKWGVVNAEGECPAGFIFDKIESYSLAAKIGDKYGALNSQGELILPVEYDQIFRSVDSELLFFTKGETEGWLNRADGSYVETAYRNLIWLNDDGYVRWKDGGKCGFLDLDGNMVAEFANDNLIGFNGEYATVAGDSFFERGIMNREGELILEQKYVIGGKIDRHNVVEVHDEDGNGGYFRIVDDEFVPVTTLYDTAVPEVVTLNKPVQIDFDEDFPVPVLKHVGNTYSISNALINLDMTGEAPEVESGFFARIAVEEGEADIGFLYKDQLPEIYERWEALQPDVEYEFSYEARQLGWDYFWMDDALRGWEYISTPVAMDALVFVTHEDNPVENLSSEAIRGIYGGQITDWSALGGVPGEIASYQYHEESGEQHLLTEFMEGMPVVAPDDEYIPFGDGERAVLCYRNLPGAIGFCRRSHGLLLPEEIKVIAVDGIYPTVENIQNGSYPWTESVYALTRSDTKNPNVRILMDWILSPQGRELIEKAGYIPIR